MLDKVNKNRKSEKINLVMLSIITSALIATAIPVLGFDQNNPASFTIQYIIPSSTQFTVQLCGSETAMIFNPLNASSKSVEPNCQSIASNKPWATINNTGNVNETYSVNLSRPNPSWALLYVGSNPSMTGNVAISDAVVSPSGWNNINNGNSVQLYALASFTNALNGTFPNTITISD